MLDLDNRAKVLEFSLEGKRYELRLASSFLVEESLAAQKVSKDGGDIMDWFLGFLEKELGEDFVSTVTVGALKQLLQAWLEASNAGESSASPN